jgi:hypothetical protein
VSTRSKSVRLILVVVAVLSGIGLFVIRREPAYHGRPLSAWLAQLDSGGFIVHGPRLVTLPNTKHPVDDAKQAIEQMGESTLPTLMRMSTAHDSSLRLLLRELFTRQHIINFPFTTAETLRRRACYGMTVLGPSCMAALPDLIKALEHRNREVRHFATQIIGGIGPAAAPAVEPLCQLASRKNEEQRFAILALGKIGAGASNAVPMLIEATDQNNETQWIAAQALARVGQRSVAPLTKMATSAQSTPQQHLLAVWALGSIGPAARSAAPMLVDLFLSGHDDTATRLAALHALGKIGIEDPAVIKLVSTIEKANGALNLGNPSSSVVNGHFELTFAGEPPNGGIRDLSPGTTELRGWESYLSRVVLRYDNPKLTDGFIIELGPDSLPGEISQAFLTEPGQSYELSLLAAAGRNKLVRICVGDLDATFIPGTEYPIFSPTSFRFRAISTLTTITFGAVEEEAFGPLIGAVSVQKLP